MVETFRRYVDLTLEDVSIVLKGLTNNKSKDPLGFANELFKPEHACGDLKPVLLKMSNGMKKQQVFPEALNICKISRLYKKK